jgi:hypothetical protein
MDNTRLFGTEDIDEVQRIWEDMSWSRFDRCGGKNRRDSRKTGYEECDSCDELCYLYEERWS